MATQGMPPVGAIQHADGSIHRYDGPWGEERLVRIEYPDGTVRKYEGYRGVERLVWEKRAGEIRHYAGSRGMEVPVRVEPLGSEAADA